MLATPFSTHLSRSSRNQSLHPSLQPPQSHATIQMTRRFVVISGAIRSSKYAIILPRFVLIWKRSGQDCSPCTRPWFALALCSRHQCHGTVQLCGTGRGFLYIRRIFDTAWNASAIPPVRSSIAKLDEFMQP